MQCAAPLRAPLRAQAAFDFLSKSQLPREVVFLQGLQGGGSFPTRSFVCPDLETDLGHLRPAEARSRMGGESPPTSSRFFPYHCSFGMSCPAHVVAMVNGNVDMMVTMCWN